jgi:hypothetical protein
VFSPLQPAGRVFHFISTTRKELCHCAVASRFFANCRWSLRLAHGYSYLLILAFSYQVLRRVCHPSVLALSQGPTKPPVSLFLNVFLFPFYNIPFAVLLLFETLAPNHSYHALLIRCCCSRSCYCHHRCERCCFAASLFQLVWLPDHLSR